MRKRIFTLCKNNLDLLESVSHQVWVIYDGEGGTGKIIFIEILTFYMEISSYFRLYSIPGAKKRFSLLDKSDW